MITIWKLENESWALMQEVEDMTELLSTLVDLRLDGSEYRAEIRIESTSSILEV